MAYPQVRDVGTYNTTPGAITHECDFPTLVSTDDLLLIIVAANPTGQTITLSESGRTALANETSTNHAFAVF